MGIATASTIPRATAVFWTWPVWCSSAISVRIQSRASRYSGIDSTAVPKATMVIHLKVRHNHHLKATGTPRHPRTMEDITRYASYGLLVLSSHTHAARDRHRSNLKATAMEDLHFRMEDQCMMDDQVRHSSYLPPLCNSNKS